jgi:MerR family transcriptional regulator, heat shock protein HspR
VVARKARKKELLLEIPDDEPVYTSGVVTRLLGIPVWVLKQLDQESLVKPSRTKGRYRFYSQNELKKLKRVWHYMSERHVNVHGVRVILEMETKIST